MRLKGWIGSEIGLEYKTFCWGFMNKRLYKARGGGRLYVGEYITLGWGSFPLHIAL